MNTPDQWPQWATETVEVAEPDPAWVRRGEKEAALLNDLLAHWRAAAVEHIGSTAVPGLPAKPIIDLQTPVADLGCADAVAALLTPHDWHAVPAELDQRPWRRLFVRVADGKRASHLHLVDVNSHRWRDQLAFRDALRADPGLAAEYATLKRELAKRHEADREAYTRAKSDFVQRVLQTHTTS